jgi:hypothetical protein
MFIRILNFETDGNRKSELLTVMDTMIPFIRSQKGCTDCLFIMNDDNRYALLVFWDSKENADGAAGIIGPKMLPSLNKISKEPINPVLYEVYQQRV